jgi:hypothetical protein
MFPGGFIYEKHFSKRSNYIIYTQTYGVPNSSFLVYFLAKTYQTCGAHFTRGKGLAKDSNIILTLKAGLHRYH